LHRYVRWGIAPVPTKGPPNGYPLLVRFRDLADPTSVERVDPDDLANSFGKGVTLKAITVARTEAEVSRGIEGRLPWLEKIQGGLMKMPRNVPVGQPMPLAVNLSDADFRIGVLK
jgi:hypothetical protein